GSAGLASPSPRSRGMVGEGLTSSAAAGTGPTPSEGTAMSPTSGRCAWRVLRRARQPPRPLAPYPADAVGMKPGALGNLRQGEPLALASQQFKVLGRAERQELGPDVARLGILAGPRFGGRQLFHARFAERLLVLQRPAVMPHPVRQAIAGHRDEKG